MNLYKKPSLILTSVAISAQLAFANFAIAQNEIPASTEEDQIVIAADTIPDLGLKSNAGPALSYGAEFIPYISEDLIADRLGCLQNEINLEYNRTIQSFIEFFVVRKRDYTKMVLGRTDLYFPIFEEYLKKYNMPPELKYLSVVESGLNPRILSRVKAGGLWQFMPGTGRDFKLYQDAYVDERFDPYKSTEAACKYLKQLYNLFGDWELALASYNCGPGNVRRAIRRSGNQTGFWAIYNYLPRETRSYVPQFVALAYVLNYAEDYKLRADSVERTIPFDTIQVSQHVNMEALARHLDTPLKDLQQLNPHLKRNLVPPYLKNYPIRIPSDRYELFAANRSAIMDSVSKAQPLEANNFLLAKLDGDNSNSRTIQKKLSHTVRRGESIGKVANRYGVEVSEIKRWNHIRSTKLRSGQRLVIWQEKRIALVRKDVKLDKQAPVALADTAIEANNEASSTTNSDDTQVVKATKIQKKTIHTVKSGESLGLIAEKYNVGLSQLKEWNNLKKMNVRSGQKLTVFTDQDIQVEKKQAKADKVIEKSMSTSEPELEKTSEDKVTHTVLKGEGLFRIANLYHVNATQIKEWNNLSSNNVKVGQHLVIWKSNAPETQETAASSSSKALISEQKDVSAKTKTKELKEEFSSKQGDLKDKSAKSAKGESKYYVVQKGDTLWSIARQLGNIPVEKLKKLNKLKGNEVKAGQKLIVG